MRLFGLQLSTELSQKYHDTYGLRKTAKKSWAGVMGLRTKEGPLLLLLRYRFG